MGNPLDDAGWFISWNIHENPIQVNDDLGVPLFQESSISNFTILHITCGDDGLTTASSGGATGVPPTLDDVFP